MSVRQDIHEAGLDRPVMGVYDGRQLNVTSSPHAGELADTPLARIGHAPDVPTTVFPTRGRVIVRVRKWDRQRSRNAANRKIAFNPQPTRLYVKRGNTSAVRVISLGTTVLVMSISNQLHELTKKQFRKNYRMVM